MAMTDSEGAHPIENAAGPDGFVVRNGGGLELKVGTRTHLTGRAAWTGGAYCVMDQLVAPRLLGAPHVHDQESQVTIVIEGRIGFWIDGEELEAGPGDYVFRPPGKAHSLWNPSDESARIQEITSPGARFEEYMVKLGAMNAGAADPEEVKAHAQRYGVTFLTDGTLEQLCARHGVSPTGGFWK